MRITATQEQVSERPCTSIFSVHRPHSNRKKAVGLRLMVGIASLLALLSASAQATNVNADCFAPNFTESVSMFPGTLSSTPSAPLPSLGLELLGTETVKVIFDCSADPLDTFALNFELRIPSYGYEAGIPFKGAPQFTGDYAKAVGIPYDGTGAYFVQVLPGRDVVFSAEVIDKSVSCDRVTGIGTWDQLKPINSGGFLGGGCVGEYPFRETQAGPVRMLCEFIFSRRIYHKSFIV